MILIRWVLTVSIMILLRNHNEFQIVFLLIISVTFQLILVSSKPHLKPLNNSMSLFIEIMTSLYLYTLLCLTDFLDDRYSQIRSRVSLFLIGILCVTVSANMLVAIFSAILWLRRKKFCVKRSKKYIEE